MRIRFVALSLVLAVVAACTSTPIPDSFDWCYTYDFRQPVDYMNLIDGEWIEDEGLLPADGLIRFNFQHIRIVEPNVVFVRASRAPDVTGEIAIAAAGEVFSVIAAFNNTMPGDMVDVELPFIPETLGTGSSVVNITLEAAQPILLREIEVRGIGVTPFDRNDCGPETPTPTPSGTPIPLTPTITATPTISATPDTPVPTATPGTSECTPSGSNVWCITNYDTLALMDGYAVTSFQCTLSYDPNLRSYKCTGHVSNYANFGILFTMQSNYNQLVLGQSSSQWGSVSRCLYVRYRTGGGSWTNANTRCHSNINQLSRTVIWTRGTDANIPDGVEVNLLAEYYANTAGGISSITMEIHGTGAIPEEPVTPTNTASPTLTLTLTPTTTATPSRTGLPTLAPSSTIPATATQLSLFSPTPLPTNTPPPSATPRNTNTPWSSPTFIPSPTLFMTSTFVPTNTPAPGTVTPGGETQTPIPDETPGGDDGEQQPDDTGQAQLDVLWLILNLLSQFFNWIANVIGTFFAWLGQLFALIVGIFEAIISLIAAIIGLIIKILEWLFNIIGLILGILWLLVQIIFRVIFLVAAWMGLVITRLAAIFNGIINAQPVPIPGLPLCETAPLQSDLCAIYYILDWTLFAPATPGESIITVAIGLTVLSIIFFVIYRLIRLTKTGSKGGFSC